MALQEERWLGTKGRTQDPHPKECSERGRRRADSCSLEDTNQPTAHLQEGTRRGGPAAQHFTWETPPILHACDMLWLWGQPFPGAHTPWHLAGAAPAGESLLVGEECAHLWDPFGQCRAEG